MQSQSVKKSKLGFSLNCRGQLIDLSKPLVMGILNVTPDSFSDGGRYHQEKNAIVRAEEMMFEGAAIIDIGAQSTRPNAEKIDAKEEIQRLGSVIKSIKKINPKVLISLDTFYAETVKFGFDEGIDLVNDISGGQYDPNLLKTVAETGLPYVLMHVNATYDEMHHKIISEDLLVHLNRYFFEKAAVLQALGIKDIILDPGFGFGKTVVQNQELIEYFGLVGFGEFPLLAGISRKSFIYKPLNKTPLEIAEETQNLHLKLIKNGAQILRVHDVAPTVALLKNN